MIWNIKTQAQSPARWATIDCPPREVESGTAMVVPAVPDDASTIAAPRRRRKLNPHWERPVEPRRGWLRGMKMPLEVAALS